MRVLVTGASGFVGKSLCRRLVDEGHQVIGVTRSKLELNGIDSRRILNWQDEDVWCQILEGIDVVIHLAARVHIMHDTAKDPLYEFRKANVENTKTLVSAAFKCSVKKFIFVSSAHVNGVETHGRAFLETDLPNPQEPYAVSKKEAEEHLLGHYSDSPMEVSIIRPPLVYGPGVGGNFYQLMRVVQKTFALPFSDFTNKRSMIYVENFTDFLCHLLVIKVPVRGVYLVRDGLDLSFGELVTTLSKLMPRSAKIFYFPKPLLAAAAAAVGKSKEFSKLSSELRVSSSLAESKLRWVPKYSVQEGLRETVEWFLKKS